MTSNAADGHEPVRYGSEQAGRGAGGETHQVAGGGRPSLTTQQGVVVADGQNTLRIGERGPAALEDFHFREKLFHFDHERIPERVVHARGFGAHGFFENYESLTDITRADLFARPGERTPAFVRFSTVAGNKGSGNAAARDFVTDAYAHCKYIGYTSDAAALLSASGVSELMDGGFVKLTSNGKDAAGFVHGCRQLRFWEREAAG